jgi:hypothetical protein
MMEKIGEKNFIRTKFDGLDGRTTVSLVSEDDSMQAKCTSAGMEFKIVANSREDMLEIVKTVGHLFDATYKDFSALSNCAKAKLIRSH